MNRLIVITDRQRGLAKHGFQPWYIPDDERYFTQQTKMHGGLALIGLTTFRTFKGPLAERRNFVLTHDTTPIEGVELVHDLEAFLREYESQDVWVIGGAKVFAQVMALGRADELRITKVEADFGCDQFFPEYEADYNLIEHSVLHEQNGFIFSYNTYTKRPL